MIPAENIMLDMAGEALSHVQSASLKDSAAV
jgi:hypothetical protein